jgi:hypothetical protein
MLFLQEFERGNHVFSFARALSTLVYATIHRCPSVPESLSLINHCNGNL